jgi:hypothetical protein
MRNEVARWKVGMRNMVGKYKLNIGMRMEDGI